MNPRDVCWLLFLMIGFFLSEGILAQNIQNSSTDSIKSKFKEAKINPRKERSFGVYGVIFDVPAYSSFAISYFPTSTINVEGGIGILGLYGQLTYHLKGSINGKRHTFYMGGTIVESGNFGTNMMSFYFPLGIKWIGYTGLALTIEIPAFKLDENIPSMAVKIGYHF